MEEEDGPKIRREMMNSAGGIMNLSILPNSLSTNYISDGAQKEDKSIFVTSVLMLSVTSVSAGTLGGNI